MVYLGEGGRVPYLNKDSIVRNVEEVLGECWGKRSLIWIRFTSLMTWFIMMICMH